MTAPATLTPEELDEIERITQHTHETVPISRSFAANVLAAIAMARRTAEAVEAYDRLDMAHAQLVGMHTAQKNRADAAEQRAAGLSEQVAVLREALERTRSWLDQAELQRVDRALAATAPELREGGR